MCLVYCIFYSKAVLVLSVSVAIGHLAQDVSFNQSYQLKRFIFKTEIHIWEIKRTIAI